MKQSQKSILLVICSLLMVFLFMSCDREKETGGSFSGYVYKYHSFLTSLPADSVMISIGDTNSVLTYTDTIGYFEGILSNGKIVTLYVRKEGYHLDSLIFDLRDNRSDLIFEILPTGPIHF